MLVSKVLVAGSGVIGLRTAQELLRRNVRVVLRSPKHPLDPSVCSQGAGGLWMPFHCDDERTDRWAIETLDELDDAGAEAVPAVLLQKEAVPDPPAWTRDARANFRQVSLDELMERNRDLKLRIPPRETLESAGYTSAWLFHPPVVDAPAVLETMLDHVIESGADVDVETGRYFNSLREMTEAAKDLGCDGLINCSGLGAADVCGDSNLVGARGILHHYDRTTCRRLFQGDRDAVILVEDAPWGTESMPAYIIPRGNTIVVGGSYLENDAEPNIRDHERENLIRNARLMGIDTDRSDPIGEWVGFRPYRPIARCGLDHDIKDIRTVHSYGYGGSGWTVFVGAAKEAVHAMLGNNR